MKIMISENKFIELAEKHLYAISKPKNAFGQTKLEIFGFKKLYKAIQKELLIEIMQEDEKDGIYD